MEPVESNLSTAFVYIVVENSDEESPGGGVFPTTYTSFEDAKAAVVEKYKDELDRQIRDGDSPMKDINVLESKTGYTSLYIEKGIHFFIHKLPLTCKRN